MALVRAPRCHWAARQAALAIACGTAARVQPHTHIRALHSEFDYGKTGSLNLNVRGLGHSPTIAINDLSNARLQRGETVFKWGLGQSPFPVPRPMREALQRAAGEKDYLPGAGLLALREVVAAWTSQERALQRDRLLLSGVLGSSPDAVREYTYTAEDVLIGPGSKELMFVLQLVFYGDLIIPRGSWVSYAPQARIVGRHIHWLPTVEKDDWKVTADILQSHCASDHRRPRLLILNSPSNPVGSHYLPAELDELAHVCRENNVLVLSDEIYAQVTHAGHSHTSMTAFYPEGTILSTGISKHLGAGGWRLGTFVFPQELGWLRHAMTSVATETYTSVSSPIQHASIPGFTHDDPEIAGYIRGSCRILAGIAREITRRLRDAGVRVPDPTGGFYLFPNFSMFADQFLARGIKTDADLAAALIHEAGVAMLPGKEFGLEPSLFTLRLAYVNFNGQLALDALSTEETGSEPVSLEFVQRHCAETLAACDAVTSWLAKL